MIDYLGTKCQSCKKGIYLVIFQDSCNIMRCNQCGNPQNRYLESIPRMPGK